MPSFKTSYFPVALIIGLDTRQLPSFLAGDWTAFPHVKGIDWCDFGLVGDPLDVWVASRCERLLCFPSINHLLSPCPYARDLLLGDY